MSQSNRKKNKSYSWHDSLICHDGVTWATHTCLCHMRDSSDSYVFRKRFICATYLYVCSGTWLIHMCDMTDACCCWCCCCLFINSTQHPSLHTNTKKNWHTYARLFGTSSVGNLPDCEWHAAAPGLKPLRLLRARMYLNHEGNRKGDVSQSWGQPNTRVHIQYSLFVCLSLFVWVCSLE